MTDPGAGLAGFPVNAPATGIVSWPRLHEAWVEEVGETHIRVRPTASPFGEMIGNDYEVRWPSRPEGFVVVKGHGLI